MDAAEVRSRIFDDHAVLRERLSEIEELNERFEKGGAEVGDELRDRGMALIEMFAAHLTLEDAHLVPALRSMPGEGEYAASRLEREHREQRELLRFLVSRLEEETHPTALVSRELESFCECVKVDMAHEESTILREDLLSR